MEHPRPRHQTQPIYTAPRMSDRLDRVSPLNNRRNIDSNSYHDNKLSNSRHLNKSRRHSNNSYSMQSSVNERTGLPTNTKDLSPSNCSGNGSQSNHSGGSNSMGNSYYEKKDRDSTNINSQYSKITCGKKLIKRKKTTQHYENSNSNSNVLHKPKSHQQSSTSASSSSSSSLHQHMNNNINNTSNSSNINNNHNQSSNIGNSQNQSSSIGGMKLGGSSTR